MIQIKSFKDFQIKSLNESKQEWFALGNSGCSILPYENGFLKVRIDLIMVYFNMFDKDFAFNKDKTLRLLKTTDFKDFNKDIINNIEINIYQHLNDKLEGDW